MTEQEAQALLMQGAAIDHGEEEAAQIAVTGTAAQPQNPDAAAMEWLIVPEIIAWGITAVFPETIPHYSDEAKMNLARKIAPVAEKYGWSSPGDAPELGLAVGAIGFSMPAVLAYRARKEKSPEGPENKPQGGANDGN